MHKMNLKRSLFLLNLSLSIAITCTAQQTVIKDSSSYLKIKASSNYNKSKFYKLFWGEHYRKEWNTPVLVKQVMLDTMRGGLTAYQTGGSRQTKSIRVRDKNDGEYAFRSVDKSFGGALPEIALGTFIETLANDQVTISHPYSALVVAPLAEAAKIYHAKPELVYVPKQNALGKFSDSTGNTLYTFEQRPDENWETAANFGNSKKIVGTDKMLEKILEDNDNKVDQKAFVRARLFDIFIGDWGRHDDQWRWATFKDGKKTTYVPIPRDRDNAFTKFDGVLLNTLIRAAGAYHLQSFDYKLKNTNDFSFPARNLDHHLLNEVTEEDWIAIANDLKIRLTDQVINDAVRKFPPEVYPISGPTIAAKLKARREYLPQWAATYCKFLNVDVEITGTKDDEKFEIKRVSDTTTEINIYKIKSDEEISRKPFYHRVFKNKQTNEIRLYGIEGNDEYIIKGNVNKSIKIRMIGGHDTDNYTDESTVKGPSQKTKIYDNPGNNVVKTKETEVITSRDSAINRYEYKYFEYSRRRRIPLLFFDQNDRLFVGLAFLSSKQKWRKEPFANTQYFDVKYSISQKGFSTTYKSVFKELIGKWDLRNYANFDQIRWNNFYGLGNNTVLDNLDRNFHRVRSEEYSGNVNIDRVFQNKHKFTFGVGYSSYKIISDTDRFLIQGSAIKALAMNGNEEYGALNASYIFQTLNDSILPTKGISFKIGGDYVNNIGRSINNVTHYSAETNLYVPLSKKFSLKLRGGGTTLSGDPQFYQYNKIGGSETLRGHQRDRFFGNQTAFNQNELRFITNVRSYLFNGKFGVFALYDQGRVWLKGETSNKVQYAYGGGLILSFFNRLSVTVAYAVSAEDSNIHVGIVKPF